MQRHQPDQQISHSLVKALRRVPAFEALPDRDLLQIVGASVNLVWPAGSVVFQQGAHAEALYIVLSGRIRIFAQAGEKEIDVASIGPGDYFGELALLREETHSKTAEASEESELMVIPEGSFQRLLASDSALAEHVSQKMERRLQANVESLKLT
jgi:CRP-like cAMP-binding protein